MRIVMIGAGELSIMTAGMLLSRKHDVIIVESKLEKIEELKDTLDCGYIHGDGTRPTLLSELSPEQTDFLFCLTDSDKDNILSGLVGQSLGFKRVMIQISDPESEHICIQLGLHDVIIPVRTISHFLSNFVAGLDVAEMSTVIKGDVRFFPFVASEEDETKIKDIELPAECKVIAVYHKDQFIMPGGDTQIRSGDEVVLLTRSSNLPDLQGRWGSQIKEAEKSDAIVELQQEIARLMNTGKHPKDRVSPLSEGTRKLRNFFGIK